jgi:prevent-host-death family protein
VSLDATGPTWLDVAMRTVKIAELKDRLSEHLRAVEKGTVSEVIVTDRGRPVARILPIESRPPRVTIHSSKVPFSEVRNLRFKPADWPVSSLELLREERGDR